VPTIADVVTVTLQNSTGVQRDYSMSVDDYDGRSASGDLDKFIEHGLGKVRREWTPDFTEVNRRVTYAVEVDLPTAGATIRAALDSSGGVRCDDR
jgi:hypothetical protein